MEYRLYSITGKLQWAHHTCQQMLHTSPLFQAFHFDFLWDVDGIVNPSHYFKIKTYSGLEHIPLSKKLHTFVPPAQSCPFFEYNYSACFNYLLHTDALSKS